MSEEERRDIRRGVPARLKHADLTAATGARPVASRASSRRAASRSRANIPTVVVGDRVIVPAQGEVAIVAAFAQHGGENRSCTGG